ncbi:MAG: flagellar protein FlgN [Bacteriovoracia bacterium]
MQQLRTDNNNPLNNYYRQVVNIWEKFCKLHSKLYEKTCDEYMCLLSSDIEKLQDVLAQKEETIEQIKIIENRRQNVINNLKQPSNGNYKIEKVSDLLGIMKKFEDSQGEQVLQKYNLLLIDIIEKIQEQNKQNQIFLNKAIMSLQEIKDSFRGQKKYSTYTAAGTTRSSYR